MTRVAIFNDSATLRRVLRECLESAPDFEVVLEAPDGRNAPELVASHQVDMVLMDVIMPHVDGYEATRQILKSHSLPIVIVTSALDPKDSRVIFQALATGALFVTAPPSMASKLSQGTFIQLLRAMVAARPRASESAAPKERIVPPSREAASVLSLNVIALVASAGGPQALTQILRALPPGVLPPVLVVQHMASGFDRSFANWLSSDTGHRVDIAESGAAELGGVYIAPEGHHLTWSGGRMLLTDAAPVDRFRPSATVLLESLAPEKNRSLSVILSGMGSDGARGAIAVHAAGGHVIAQDEESSAVWGMPGAVVKQGTYDVVLPLDDIARHILERTGL